MAMLFDAASSPHSAVQEKPILVLMPRVGLRPANAILSKCEAWERRLGEGNANARFRLLAPFHLLERPKWASENSFRENRLLSTLSGVHVYNATWGNSGLPVLAVSASTASIPEAVSFGQRNEALLGIEAPDFDTREGQAYALDNYALYRVASQLAQHSGGRVVFCHGWQVFEAGLRLKKELGLKCVFCFPSTEKHAARMHGRHPSRGVVGREYAALSNADAIIASRDYATLESLHRHYAPSQEFSRSKPELAIGLAKAAGAVGLSSERSVLYAVATSPVSAIEEKRAALSRIKKIDLLLSEMGVKRDSLALTAGAVSAIPPAFESKPAMVHPARANDALGRMRGAIALSGSVPPCDDFLYASFDNAGANNVDAIFAGLSLVPHGVGMVVKPSEAVGEQELAEAAERHGVSDRVVVMPPAWEESHAMAVARAIVLAGIPDSETLSNARAAVKAAEFLGRPTPAILPLGSALPAMHHVNLDGASASGLISAVASGEGEIASKLMAASKHLLLHNWSADDEARHYALIADELAGVPLRESKSLFK
ncbi:hypothetical protein HY995_05460 [Candidatus Micrarchaeota archaeon]|nr:hypothetical protein [Candidatus Micrarchaeota archaeon]MBI5177503.1 hypothetical protein [Candidatus Micrarchaeota archaeon]